MSVRRRPWYISDRLCSRYTSIAANGGDVVAMQTLKIIEGIVANIVLAALAVFFVDAGADPTIIGTGTLTVLGILNGVSLSEYLAARQALEEVDLDE